MLALIISSVIIAYVVFCFISGLTGFIKFKPLTDKVDVGYIKHDVQVVEVKQPPVVIYKKSPPKIKTVYKEDTKKVKLLEKQVSTLRRRINKIESKPVVQPPKQERTETKTPHPLFNDFVDALVALGYKKTSAKQEVVNYLSKNSVNSIEEFIVDFFKKDKNG
jgi:hypothetical protein